MKHFISQFGDTCRDCGKEIQKGEWFYFNDFDDRCVCEDCYDEEDDDYKQ